MNRKKDIETLLDIELLVNSFYRKLQANPVVGYIFMDVTRFDREKYLHGMIHFWENVLFYTGGYYGNPLTVHRHLNKLFPLTAEHFNEWNKLFAATVDDLFIGEKSALAKQRAFRISAVIQSELQEGGKN